MCHSPIHASAKVDDRISEFLCGRVLVRTHFCDHFGNASLAHQSLAGRHGFKKQIGVMFLDRVAGSPISRLGSVQKRIELRLPDHPQGVLAIAA
jgi:hypothetical protein